MGLIAWLVIGALVLAVGAGSGWEGRKRWDAQELADLKASWQKEKDAAMAERDAEQARANEIATRFETKLSKLRIVNTTVQQEVRRETERVVYGDPNCDLPASGVMLVNSAIREANRAAGNVPSEVPAPARTSTGPGNAGRTVQP